MYIHIELLVDLKNSYISMVLVLEVAQILHKDRREGWTDARSAVGFCLGSGLFGSYNSD